jgi:hypothetical protein
MTRHKGLCYGCSKLINVRDSIMKGLFFFVFLFVCFIQQSHASTQPGTASAFMASCDTGKMDFKGQISKEQLSQLVKKSSCLGFVNGFLNGVNLIGANMNKSGQIKEKNIFCFDTPISPKQTMDDLSESLNNNPDRADMPVMAFLFTTFYEKYSCKKN